MRHVMLLVAVGLLVSECVMGEEKKEDAKAILGTWRGTWVETSDGKAKYTNTDEVSILWEFRKGKIVLTKTAGGETENQGEYEYSLDTKKSPWQIDLKPDRGPTAGKTMKGICKVEKDTMTISHVRWSPEGGVKEGRPTAFDLKKRADVVILTLVRKKP